jgi:hypothetical protein
MNFQNSNKSSTNRSSWHYSPESRTSQLDPCLVSNSNARSLARTENRGSSSELVVSTVGCVSVATEWRGSFLGLMRIWWCPPLGRRWPAEAWPRGGGARLCRLAAMSRPTTYRVVESKTKGAWASVTHRECVQVPFSRGDALEWLGHGEVLLDGAFGRSWRGVARVGAMTG